MTVASSSLQVAAASARPQSVGRATTLLYASLAVGLVRAALEFERLAAMSSPQFVVGIQVGVFGVLGLLVFLIGRRRNWARIIFVAMFVLGTPMSVKPLLDSLSFEPLSGVLGLAQIMVQVVAIVLLFTSEARAWFTRSRLSAEPT